MDPDHPGPCRQNQKWREAMEGGLFDSLSGILVLVFVVFILFRILTGKGG
jgi:hypothetical protein